MASTAPPMASIRLRLLPVLSHHPIPKPMIRASLLGVWNVHRPRRGKGDLIKAAEDLRDSAIFLGSLIPRDLILLAFPPLERLRTLLLLIDGGSNELRIWWPKRRRMRSRRAVNWGKLKGMLAKIVGVIAVVWVLLWNVRLI